jgi:hypothetical protein
VIVLPWRAVQFALLCCGLDVGGKERSDKRRSRRHRHSAARSPPSNSADGGGGGGGGGSRDKDRAAASTSPSPSPSPTPSPLASLSPSQSSISQSPLSSTNAALEATQIVPMYDEKNRRKQMLMGVNFCTALILVHFLSTRWMYTLLGSQQFVKLYTLLRLLHGLDGAFSDWHRTLARFWHRSEQYGPEGSWRRHVTQLLSFAIYQLFTQLHCIVLLLEVYTYVGK